MRTEGVQKLILNSNLFTDMVCEVVQEKNIRFSAKNFESKIQTFILRVRILIVSLILILIIIDKKR